MEIRSYKGDICYLVFENDVLALGRWRGWLKSNLDLGGGGGVRCVGASPEYAVPTPLGIMRR